MNSSGSPPVGEPAAEALEEGGTATRSKGKRTDLEVPKNMLMRCFNFPLDGKQRHLTLA